MDFEKTCMLFTMQEPFYGIILSSMERVPMKEVGTMGVGRSGNVFRLYYNPEFVEKLSLDNQLEFIKHECLHIAFDSWNIWDIPDSEVSHFEHTLRNFAADAEINCYLDMSKVDNPKKLVTAEALGLDKFLGTREYYKKIKEKEEQAREKKRKAAEAAEKRRKKKMKEAEDEEEMEDISDDGLSSTSQEEDTDSSKGKSSSSKKKSEQQGDTGENDEEKEVDPIDYLSDLDPESRQDNQPSSDDGSDGNDGKESEAENDEGDGEGNGFVSELSGMELTDNHAFWPNDSQEEREMVSQAIEELLARAAEETLKSCGEIPAELKVRIDSLNKKKPKPVTDWKRYCRRYLGNEFTEFIRKSKKRESRRFPDAAGNRHRRKSHILVGIDTSGSICMPEYMEFFGQIRTLTDNCSFRVLECDMVIGREYEFDGKIKTDVTGGGGTSFQPVIDYFIKNRKKYDALVYFTDGYADIPKDTPKDTLWVVSSQGDQSDRNKYKVNGASVAFIPKKK